MAYNMIRYGTTISEENILGNTLEKITFILCLSILSVISYKYFRDVYRVVGFL